jgi:hypothetical protein
MVDRSRRKSGPAARHAAPLCAALGLLLAGATVAAADPLVLSCREDSGIKTIYRIMAEFRSIQIWLGDQWTRNRCATGVCEIDDAHFVLKRNTETTRNEISIDRRSGKYAALLVVDGEKTIDNGVCQAVADPAAGVPAK